MKWGFSLENVQLSPFENKDTVVNLRHWLTEPSNEII